MGLLSRLRAWIGGESESTDGADSDVGGSDDGDREGSDADPGGDDSGGLDPSAATETRTAAPDDAVDALRDVRRSQAAADEHERAEDSDESAAEGDRDAP